jgi:hypothetical protein
VTPLYAKIAWSWFVISPVYRGTSNVEVPSRGPYQSGALGRERPQLQLPPSHCDAQLAPAAHAVWQLPPSHARLHVAPPPHCDRQLPPSHSEWQTAPGWQSSPQLPPSHPTLQTDPP